MNTYELQEAASIAKVHQDTLRKLAVKGKAPGTKIGRRWIFPVHLFDSWIENKCLSTVVVDRPTGGARYPSLAMRLANRRKQRIASKQKSSSTESGNDCGGSTS